MNAFIARVVLRAVQCDLTALATMSKEDMVHRIPKSVPDHRVLALHAYLHLEAQGSLPEDAGDEAAQTDAIMAVEEYVRPCTTRTSHRKSHNKSQTRRTPHAARRTPHAALHTTPAHTTRHARRYDQGLGQGRETPQDFGQGYVPEHTRPGVPSSSHEQYGHDQYESRIQYEQRLDRQEQTSLNSLNPLQNEYHHHDSGGADMHGHGPPSPGGTHGFDYHSGIHGSPGPGGGGGGGGDSRGGYGSGGDTYDSYGAHHQLHQANPQRHQHQLHDEHLQQHQYHQEYQEQGGQREDQRQHHVYQEQYQQQHHRHGSQPQPQYHLDHEPRAYGGEIDGQNNRLYNEPYNDPYNDPYNGHPEQYEHYGQHAGTDQGYGHSQQQRYEHHYEPRYGSDLVVATPPGAYTSGRDGGAGGARKNSRGGGGGGGGGGGSVLGRHDHPRSRPHAFGADAPAPDSSGSFG